LSDPIEKSSSGPLEGQTMPIAMVSAVSGVFSVLFAPCCALDPRLAAIIHAVLALIAVTTGLVVTQRVAAGKIDRSNIFQARIGFIAGGIALVIAAAWAIWIVRHPDGNPG
jgi:hypothetical protein